MARITIEDCIEQVPNRFQLVQMTAIRAKQLKKGATSLVQNEDNKEVVMALREIAAGKVTPDERPPEALEEEAAVESLADEAVVEAAPAEGASEDVDAEAAAEPEEAADEDETPAS